MSYAAAGVLASGVAATSRATSVGVEIAGVSTTPAGSFVFAGAAAVAQSAWILLSPTEATAGGGVQTGAQIAQIDNTAAGASARAGCLAPAGLGSLWLSAATGGAAAGGQPPDEEVRRSTAGSMWTVGDRVRKRRKRQEDEDVLLLS